MRGEGSPSPTAVGHLKLVRTGIYAHSRNPSLYGKTLGVLAVGFASISSASASSSSHCCSPAPSIEKVIRQEPQLVDVFGEEYERYRREVPLFIPWKIFLPRTWKGRQ